MDDKKTFFQRLSGFISGKGFYVILFVCFAAIGVSAYMLVRGGDTDDTSADITVEAPEPAQPYQSPVYMPDTNLPDGDAEGASAEGVPPSLSGGGTPRREAEPETESAPASAKAPEDGGAEIGDAPQGGEYGAGMAASAPTKQPAFVWPLMGDTIFPYSVDELVYNKTMGDWRVHDGIDIAGGMGAKVVSAADGEVADIFDDDLLGTTVVINHGDGITSRYSNLAATPAVKTGDKITMGAVIGSLGDTALGESGEPTHLHFAMTKDGHTVDPADYLP
ncbi:MAG: peptidoglycan DD-metalloendopeptidase family protein [Oscillospiraceae bacterium]|jgi:murein DD-endopeptidase MepM/ murein hydrolase activator NlpD|nr:peptidoglycan DD-metalloendopeptidase family protein [Oscillospiraceae bacterium]